MSNVLLKVENAGAERLWNYIIAYRRMIKATNKGSSPGSNLTFDVFPKLEVAASKPKRILKRHC